MTKTLVALMVGVLGIEAPAMAQTAPVTGPTPVSSYGVMFTLPAAPIAPGSVELETQAVLTSGPGVLIPVNLKFNPNVNVPILRNCEVAFFSDAFQTSSDGNGRNTLGVQDFGIVTRKPVYLKGILGVSVGPWLTGQRLDGVIVYGVRTMIAVVSGPNSFFVNVNYGHATKSSLDNPANRRQLQVDFFRAFGTSGKLASVGWSVGTQVEGLSDQNTTLSFAEGGYYQFRPDLELDFGFHHMAVNESTNHQFLVGLVKNFGTFKR
jgi:hypothetical protein